MDVELGLKLAKCLDEFVSTTPIFISGETDIMFILTSVLKGYTRELVKIDVNDYARSIVISGEKPVQDMVMVGWKVYKKEIKMMGFTKAFMIPDGVIIDQIKARFNKENFKLTVAMPKMVKGVKGIRIKEVKVEESDTGKYRSLQVDDDDDGNVRKIDLASGELALVPEHDEEVHHMKEKIEDEVEQDDNNEVEKSLEDTIVTAIHTFPEKIADVQDCVITPDVLPRLDSGKMGKEMEKTSEKPSMQKHKALKCAQEKAFNDEPSTTTEKKFRDQSTQTDPPRKPKKCCVPMIAGGSALIISLLVFAIQLIRDQDKPKKKKK
ncbi:SHSP domain-containing protein [Heracleum sosnowskyi]|uniref:SHSP domain-containing protein n=1 Tax=Heracleum sosnowskyi TaxID=360622 RepID=A0AAD8H5B7_9APIA|nr:SHSP domain-containing protein [Heracleum sosnowskyi]